MQKELFAVFVNEINRHCQSLLVGTDTDYRRLMAKPLKVQRVCINTHLLLQSLNCYLIFRHCISPRLTSKICPCNF